MKNIDYSHFQPLTYEHNRVLYKRKNRVKLKNIFNFLQEKIANYRAPSSRFKKIYQKTSLDSAHPIAIYAHYNSKNTISDMVLKQISILKNNGFQVIFVSMSDIESDEIRNTLKNKTTHIIIRQSFGRDFGAWRDIWLHYNKTLLTMQEVLLVNDSVVGPILPLEPLIDKMRTYEGLIGLTESSDIAPHLQSYFLLCRGQQPIAVLDKFFRNLPLSNNKRFMIDEGEIGLSKYFRQSSINIYTAFPVNELRNMVFSNHITCKKLFISVVILLNKIYNLDNLVFLLKSWQGIRGLNPTHYFWKTLIEKMGFPFIKSELLIYNPSNICDIDEWLEFIREDSPITKVDVTNHLSMMA